MNRLPNYPKKPHKSGQARIKWQGKAIYLGIHGSSQSVEQYGIVISRITAGITREKAKPSTVRLTKRTLTIAKLCEAYLTYAAERYNRNSEYDLIYLACQPLLDLFAGTLAAEFGPKALKQVRLRMVTYGRNGWCRTFINTEVGKIRRMFRWAVAEELVLSDVLESLRAVQGLRLGELGARESEPVQPVDPALLKSILPYCNRRVRTMVRVQRIVGMRPNEVCQLRSELVDMTDEVWEFRPARHKSKHRGKKLVYYLGRRAQRLLRRFVKDDPAAHWFSPLESHLERHARRRSKAKAPTSEAKKARRRAVIAKRKPGQCYTTGSYRRHIARAVSEFRSDARVRPHQLRHSAGTDIRKLYGLEGSRVALGHSHVAATELYAEMDLELARRIALERG